MLTDPTKVPLPYTDNSDTVDQDELDSNGQIEHELEQASVNALMDSPSHVTAETPPIRGVCHIPRRFHR